MNIIKLTFATLAILTSFAVNRLVNASEGMSSGIASLHEYSNKHIQLSGHELIATIDSLVNKIINHIQSISQSTNDKNKQLMRLWKNRIDLAAFDTKGKLIHENKEVESLLVNKLLPLYEKESTLLRGKKYGFAQSDPLLLTLTDEYVFENNKKEVLTRLTKKLYDLWDIKPIN